MKKTNDFGRDPIPLLVLKISVPFMFAQFVNVLYSIVDRIYVGNIPVTGADALAGVGVCAPVVTLLSSFGTLFESAAPFFFLCGSALRIRKMPGRSWQTAFHIYHCVAGAYADLPCDERSAAELVRRQ